MPAGYTAAAFRAHHHAASYPCRRSTAENPCACQDLGFRSGKTGNREMQLQGGYGFHLLRQGEVAEPITSLRYVSHTRPCKMVR
jgi:hypothetical protein